MSLGRAVLCLLGGLLTAAPASATDLYQSATMSPGGQDQGYALGPSQYLGVRFRNFETWRVERVGGHVFQTDGRAALFAAIVPLSGPDDFPDDVAMSDAVWGVSFTGPALSEDVRVDANVVLPPGWWGLVLGAGGPYGSFGSGGMAVGNPHVGYPSYFRMQNGVWEESRSRGKRFVVEGYVACGVDSGDTGDPCPEDCFDGADNDVDGFVDCQDRECWHLVECCDADGDGYARHELLCGFGPDCDDDPVSGPVVFPGAPETPDDFIDSNCDGVETCFQDLDNDRHGTGISALSTTMSCDEPGVAPVADDCDDTDPSTHPGALEIPGDGVDQTCDGDESCYVDDDGDGFGSFALTEVTGISCALLPGTASVAGDCDDADPSVWPGAPEIVADGIDQDCDRYDGCYLDLDRDGYGSALVTTPEPGRDCETSAYTATNADDCLDSGSWAAWTYPGAPDYPADGRDQDCDGVDACYLDADGDAFGGPIVVPGGGLLCLPADGVSSRGDDCVDEGPDAAQFNPGAVDTPGDGIDQDCNGRDRCWYDYDLDGFGGPISTEGPSMDCDAHHGLASRGGDCRDSGRGASTYFPGAPEVVGDGADQDCDGQDACWVDRDGDGFGGQETMPANGFVCGDDPLEQLVGGDCDDLDPAAWPGAPEIPGDDVDQDCDGVEMCYRDVDGDGWGSDRAEVSPFARCEHDPERAGRPGDCADGDPSIHPGALEVPYDGVDQDCDGVDRFDLDGDGFLWTGVGGADCDDNDPAIQPWALEVANGKDDDCNGLVDDGTVRGDDDGDGLSEVGGDCDDADPEVHPGAVETCDGRDEDCDRVIDDGTRCYDDDGDGFSEDEGDCNDGDTRMSPGLIEVTGNGIDDDCDGVIAGDLTDVDGDGYTEEGGDCAPRAAERYPGAPELPNLQDDDCDGLVDEGTVFSDDDGDGFTEQLGDCLDSDPGVYPGAPERLNGIDDDCDGLVDPLGVHADLDGDGRTVDEGDCDDTDADVFHLRPEDLDGKDNDCDGLIDEDWLDFDGDGWTTAAGDCNDHQGWSNPELPEVCDGMDNDCDGATDEGCDPPRVRVVPTPTGCDHRGGGVGWLAFLVGGVALRRGRARIGRVGS